MTSLSNCNRREWIATIAAAIAGSHATAFAQQAPPALKLESVGKNLTVLSGAGGNIALLAASDGLLMIDSGLPDTAKAVLDKAKSAGPKIAVLINTHWHYDHTGANTDIGKSGAKLIAHVNVKKRLSTNQKIAFMNRDFAPLPAEGQPAETFTDKGKVSYAGETVHYTHMPPAHTDGDTVIHFQHADVLHCGDLFFNGAYPFIDYSSGGSIEGMIANAQRIMKMAGPKTKIIPGHGPIATKADLQAYHDVLAGVNESVSKLIKEGKSVEEIQAAKPTAKWDDQWGKGFMNGKQMVALLYQGKKG